MTTEELARASLEGLNLLGHVASPQPWEELRQVEGDEGLKQALERAARVWLDVLQRTRRGPNPDVFPRATDAQLALSDLLAALPSLVMEDAHAVSRLRGHARQALEALGFPLPG